MARILQRFIEPPRACDYLPFETAQLEILVLDAVEPPLLEAMLERGWRRFGRVYFRPACAGCSECVSIRIDAARFAPSKTQRRVLRHGARLRRVVGAPRVDRARTDLYARWHEDRERARGWDWSRPSESEYAHDFGMPHRCAREAAFYDDEAGGKLVAVGLYDETPNALSAVYCYFDPDYARFSPGVLNVLSLVEDARARAIPHLYLGYRVLGCASLLYKASFRPHELLRGRPRFDEPPIWGAAS